MRIELLPGMTNVVRFPVERRARATLELLRGIAPDVREVLSLAEAFGIEPPVHDLRERADAATADYIAAQVPRDAPTRKAMLAELERAVVEPAVASCRAAHDASLEASEAQQFLLAAQTTGGFWIDGLRERAEALTERAATLSADGACTGGGGRGCGAGGRPGATRYGVGAAERRRRHGHADRCPARRGLSPRFTK